MRLPLARTFKRRAVEGQCQNLPQAVALKKYHVVAVRQPLRAGY